MGYHSTGRMLALSLLALAPVCAKPSLAQGALSVMSFGGAYQEAQRKAVFETYAASTGTKIDEQEYGGEIAKIAAMIESGNTTVDVVDVDAPTLQGWDEGIFEKVDWSAIGPKADWIDSTTSECGVGIIAYATTLAYDVPSWRTAPRRSRTCSTPRNFRANAASGRTQRPISNTACPPTRSMRPYPRRKASTAPLLSSIRSRTALSGGKPVPRPPQLLASGEVVMTTAWNGRIYNANKEGKDFRIESNRPWFESMRQPSWSLVRRTFAKTTVNCV